MKISKNITIVLSLLQLTLIGQINDSTSYSPYKTPFNPNANYQTFGVKARVLPWVLGNMGGFNYLVGFELGFLKNHSISVDGYYYGTQDHHDNYYGQNDPRNRASDNYNGGDKALFFSYNYYYNINSIREEMGISLYTGLNYRIGKASYTWDRGISKDSVIHSARNYYSFGPQVGLLINWGKKQHLVVNLNVSGLYSTKDIEQQRTYNLVLTNYKYHLNSYDLKVGVNLYWWFKYKNTKPSSSKQIN